MTQSLHMAEPWVATRAAGLDRLHAFLPCAGSAYAAKRNYDKGVGHRDNVSCLSPWIRHRLILEEEVLQTVLGEHSPEAADKFIQELCWRTYWKGWLEMRPQVWRNYRSEVNASSARMMQDADLRRRWESATSGDTGIECFDHWVWELIKTGYLHNHARMWFASIWIFTLDLPWELGADFFLRHLLDGDPASNTLSWRWVAGLQTAGKTYLANADNIARYTHGRFNPIGQLSKQAKPRTTAPKVPPQPLPMPNPPAVKLRTGLLLCDEDLCPETLHLAGVTPVAVAAFTSSESRSPNPTSQLVTDFATAAVSDGLTRAGEHFEAEATQLRSGDLASQLLDWCHRHRLDQIVTPYVPVGIAQDELQQSLPALAEHGFRTTQVRRPWDELFWPHATHGYFRFKKAIAPLICKYKNPNETKALSSS